MFFLFSIFFKASELKKSFISGSNPQQHEDLKRDKTELLKVLTKLAKGKFMLILLFKQK